MACEIYKEVYNQYWNHARHQEIQRLQFAGMYVVIVAAALAYLGSSGINNIYANALLAFLIAFSFLGYLSTYVFGIPFYAFSRKAEAISICEWNLPQNYQRFTKWCDKSSPSCRYRFPYVDDLRVFILFYSFMIGLLSSMLLVNLKIINSLQIPLIVISLILIVIYLQFLEKNLRAIQDEFERICKDFIK